MRTAGGRLVTCLLLLAGSGEGPAAAQAPGERGDLAIRARAILRRHCLECHREGNLPAGTTLKILDHSDLTRPDRPVPVVQPGNPDGSQLLHLVADGSMPPADRRKLSGEEIKVLRDWVEAGAPSFPPQFDDAFVLGAIRADLEKARPDPRTTRYVSLHAPLADDSGNVVSLAAQRRDFLAALNSLTAQVPAQAVAIEGTEAVYRLDLKQLGWDRPLFREVKGEGEEEVLAPASEARFNVFDVLLLEYPFGKLYAREGEGLAPDPAGSFKDLIEKFLVPAGQVRPVAYVRGDWLTWYLTQGDAYEELRRLLGRQGGNPARVETPAPVALREEPPPERVAVVPILPIDARTAPTVDGPRADYPKMGYRIKQFAAIDPQTGEERNTFFPGNDRLLIRIQTDRSVHFEVIWIDSKGAIDVLETKQGQDVTGTEGPRDLGFDGMGFPLAEVYGKERVVLFASPSPFARGKRYRFRDDPSIERYVHEVPLPFPGPPQGRPPAPLDPFLRKRTDEFEIIKEPVG